MNRKLWHTMAILSFFAWSALLMICSGYFNFSIYSFNYLLRYPSDVFYISRYLISDSTLFDQPFIYLIIGNILVYLLNAVCTIRLTIFAFHGTNRNWRDFAILLCCFISLPIFLIFLAIELLILLIILRRFWYFPCLVSLICLIIGFSKGSFDIAIPALICYVVTAYLSRRYLDKYEKDESRWIDGFMMWITIPLIGIEFVVSILLSCVGVDAKLKSSSKSKNDNYTHWVNNEGYTRKLKLHDKNYP